MTIITNVVHTKEKGSINAWGRPNCYRILYLYCDLLSIITYF